MGLVAGHRWGSGCRAAARAQSVTCQALQSTELLSYGMSYMMWHILREVDRGSSGLHLLYEAWARETFPSLCVCVGGSVQS